MAAPSKSEGTVLIAHSMVTHPDKLVGSELDVSTLFDADILCELGYVEAVSNANPPSFLIQTNPFASGNDGWVTKVKFLSALTGTIETEGITSVSGDDITTDSTGAQDFTERKPIYIRDTNGGSPKSTTGALSTGDQDSEWGTVADLPDTQSIILVDNPTNAKDSSDEVYEAEQFSMHLELGGISRLRVVFIHHGATGANCHVRVTAGTTDSIA